MSDLDADLYGDLYGNDENEFVVPTDSTEIAPVKVEQYESTDPPPPVKSEPIPSSMSSPPKSIPTFDSNPLSPTSTAPSGTSAIPSYTSLSTQQIPTYQERQPDFREPAPPRHDTYQGAPGADRPVRPSEMKEEGLVALFSLLADTRSRNPFGATGWVSTRMRWLRGVVNTPAVVNVASI
ncbi:uncharacterized protein BXZ73DRAFT_44877 [Epithele typhae]|uniref:uncharacterized protein n=1 Tax=Epithele typhae TaxID=378194 RepID=UPI002008E275|nr:uncharacterized protein BXZ73DRAFT_44877 [Epithele typhae]KAH9936859.1 hypothetical protein BXZ73DRAFT_44877 [Epithele typhae]